LRTINLVESTDLGKRLLAQALIALKLNPELSGDMAERLKRESSAKSLDELYADIGVGKRMAALVARHALGLAEGETARPAAPVVLTGEPTSSKNKLDPVTIHGSEGSAVQLAQCCLPIPGDDIVGQLKRDQGITVHTTDCEIARRQRIKEPDRWIDVVWGDDLNRRFDCRITLLLKNERGVLARVAAEIGESDANITSVGMEDDKDQLLMQLRFTVQVEDRVHLARLMRNVRRIPGVTRLLRERN
jgi:GTP pyrophosphokinase